MTIASTATVRTDDEIGRMILGALAESGEQLMAWAALRRRIPGGHWRAGESLTRLWLAGCVYLVKVKGRNYVGLGDEQDAQIAAKTKTEGRVPELRCL
ncbi:hypothetical protein A5756_10590 [Mycobacterium sp. 852002-53434_SCH5985345]|uniref:hypothetical protein n=1 Tax=Mycobacterium sp. 852002-53434_SCH5985345 TaxID=1834107 RepID=UPI0007FFB19C|nr:hypothetical protein [Mycobacterium sp. 852002-53434_SCH5985345]OBF56730.1 hypothetical protein A5756_10590 [Mycobacterium sp. 852002-53434_SCH5985345]